MTLQLGPIATARRERRHRIHAEQFEMFELTEISPPPAVTGQSEEAARITDMQQVAHAALRKLEKKPPAVERKSRRFRHGFFTP